MMEKEASLYLKDLEAFYSEQDCDLDGKGQQK